MNEKFSELNATRCSIEELKDKIKEDILKNEFVLLNAVVSEFDIDNKNSKTFLIKW